MDKITLKIKKSEGWRSYEVPLTKGLTVLDAIIYVKENLDPTVSYRASCRMGICGSCAMYINGKPRLACHTQVAELGSRVVTVAPLPNYPVIRDLVPDLSRLFRKHSEVEPYLMGSHVSEEPSQQILQEPSQLLEFLQFSYCIKCGACLAACPTVATSESFWGPQALTQAYRFIVDSRDAATRFRIEKIDTADGPFRCHFAGSCSEACPKGVDPALAIQQLKKVLAWGIKKPEVRLQGLAEEYVPNEKYKVPEPTVKE